MNQGRARTRKKSQGAVRYLLKIKNIMKKKIHLPIHQITITCSYCNQEYKTISTSSQNISNSSCSNCNPFYTGALASEMNVGAVEKFRQRAQKTKARA